MNNKELLYVFYTAMKKTPFNLKQKTIKSYIKSVGYLLNYLDNKSILEITKNDIKRYLADLDGSDSTYNVYLSSFRTLYQVLSYDARTEELIISDPTVGIVNIKKPKSNKKEESTITRVEYERLIKYSKNSRDKAIVVLLYNCGLRIDEALNLTLKQYTSRTNDNMIILTHTKRDKERIIFLNDKTVDAINKYLINRKDNSEYLFTSNQGNKLDDGNFRRTVKVIAKRAGFDEDRVNEMHCHLFRKSCATNLANKGVSIQVVSEVLGHSSIQTTSKIYIKNDLSLLKQAMCQ